MDPIVLRGESDESSNTATNNMNPVTSPVAAAADGEVHHSATAAVTLPRQTTRTHSPPYRSPSRTSIEMGMLPKTPKTGAIPGGFEKDTQQPAPPVGVCMTGPLCPHSPPSPLFPLSSLKPRFLRILRQQYPNITIPDSLQPSTGADLTSPLLQGRQSRASLSIDKERELMCCLAHLKLALQGRADELVDEDMAEFAKFQEEVVRDMGEFEMAEAHWQDRFEKDRSLGERSADRVARVGGSWNFLFGLGGIILTWCFLNGVLPVGGGQWDAYPFILLNLMLSMIASVQAPVIMMANNRQAAIDRLQSEFVSRAVLRNENQTRHIDAKIDHLISYQWKRLLEIQEIQIQLLQEAVEEGGVFNGRGRSVDAVKRGGALAGNGGAGKEVKFWSAESYPDEFTRLLLRNYAGAPRDDDSLIFSHWHEEGDNFNGFIQNVHLSLGKDHLHSLTFDISFPTQASFDDVLQGEVTVTFRNDFNIPHMTLQGRLQSIKYITSGSTQGTVILNGEFPPRYKPTFVRHRPDRVTELWKTHFSLLTLVYIPPPVIAILHVPAGMIARSATASCFSETRPALMKWRKVKVGFEFRGLLEDMTILDGVTNEAEEGEADDLEQGKPRSVKGGWHTFEPKEKDHSERIGHFPVFEVFFEDAAAVVPEIPIASPSSIFMESTLNSSDTAAGATVSLGGILGPCTILLASDRRIGWQGILERADVVQEMSRKLTEMLRDSKSYGEL